MTRVVTAEKHERALPCDSACTLVASVRDEYVLGDPGGTGTLLEELVTPHVTGTGDGSRGVPHDARLSHLPCIVTPGPSS